LVLRLIDSLIFLLLRPPPRPTLFPYTTLFRSTPWPAWPPSMHTVLSRSGRRCSIASCKAAFVTGTGAPRCGAACRPGWGWTARRSEEHTSELQSRENLVCRLLLEKKKKKKKNR